MLKEAKLGKAPGLPLTSQNPCARLAWSHCDPSSFRLKPGLPSSLIGCKGMSRSRRDEPCKLQSRHSLLRPHTAGLLPGASVLDTNQQRLAASIPGGGVNHLWAPVEVDGHVRWQPGSQSQPARRVPAAADTLPSLLCTSMIAHIHYTVARYARSVKRRAQKACCCDASGSSGSIWI